MDVDRVRKILDRPMTNINAVNDHGRNALHISAIHNCPDVIEILCDHRQGHHKGMWKFVTTKIKTEVERESIDLNLQDVHGDSPLSVALKWNSIDAANILLQKLKDTPEKVDWNEAWSNCQSSRMQEVLEKHQPLFDMGGGESVRKHISKDNIIIRLPKTFLYLLSLLIDKLFATFPSPIVFLNKVTGNKSKVSFKQMKIKNGQKSDYNNERLDSGVEVSIFSLAEDINFISDIKKDEDNKTHDIKYAHEYVNEAVRRKLPVL